VNYLRFKLTPSSVDRKIAKLWLNVIRQVGLMTMYNKHHRSNRAVFYVLSSHLPSVKKKESITRKTSRITGENFLSLHHNRQKKKDFLLEVKN